MQLKERARYIHKYLTYLFPKIYQLLNYNDSYTLLIAVLLSARCQDKRVNAITPILFKKAHTPLKMSKLSIKEIEDIIYPCGFFSKKAKAILELSKILIQKYSGEVPSSFSKLISLPGVGRKTALVVQSQFFNIPTFPVDTHIHRLARVWGLTNGNNVLKTEEDLKKCFPKAKWNELHLRFIYYGREICKSRSCNGLKCTLCQYCFPRRVFFKKTIFNKKH